MVEGVRRDEFAGPITLVGAESHLPYDRPPLSKQFLSGTWDEERLLLRDAAAIEALDVELALGVAACRLDTAAAVVELHRRRPGAGLRRPGHRHLASASMIPGGLGAGIENDLRPLRTLDDAIQP